MAQQVWCNKKKYHGNKELFCVCDGEFWYCPDLETNGCQARYSIMEPLFSQKSKRGIKDTLQILYILAQGIAVKHILRESTPSRVTVMAVTQMLEFIIAMAHDMRFDAAEGTVVFMQKDETCASKIKRMGCGKGKRVRRDGSSWYHTLVNCDQVLDTTGGAAASKYLSREWRHGVVNHKK